MIVRSLNDIEAAGRAVAAANWTSRRLILADDGVGYSLHDTVLRAGSSTEMRYTNHIESVYCIAGEGELLDRTSGQVHQIRPGTLYVLNDHDAHTLTCTTDLRVVCVFTPPLVGPETHDADGSYPLLTTAAPSDGWQC